jgi:uncharacterized damage-inducible protein DinB
MSVAHDALRSHLVTMHGAVRRLVEDISEEESMRTINGYQNHIKWLTGHILTTTALSGKLLGGRINLPEGWNELFRRGAALNPDPKAFPAMEAVRERLFDYQRMVIEFVDLTAEAELGSEIEIAPGWQDTRIGAVLFLKAHDFYHAGQIAVIRRALGRERSFG